MKKTFFSLATVLLLAGLTGLAQAPKEFKVFDPMGRNVVQFRTSAPLEDIVGTTNQISGDVTVDPGDLKSGRISARFDVKLASLDTGISLRNTHMKDNYLQTNRYPEAIFTLKKITSSPRKDLKPNQGVHLIAEGTFQLHGVERKIKVPVTVTYLPASKTTMSKLPGNLLRIQASFPVKLADYNIERPQMVVLKVGEVAHVNVEAFATDASRQQIAMWAEQMKKMMAGSE